MASTTTVSEAALRASARLADAIANEIELIAIRRGVQVPLDDHDIEVIAERVVAAGVITELIEPPIDATELAQRLGVTRDWVYANATRLGAIKLGDGPKARLRFDLATAMAALHCEQSSMRVTQEEPRRGPGRPRGTRRRSTARLIRGRGERTTSRSGII